MRETQMRMQMLSRDPLYGYGPIPLLIFTICFFFVVEGPLFDAISLAIFYVIICILWVFHCPQYIWYNDEKVVFDYYPLPLKTVLLWKDIDNVKVDKKWRYLTIKKRKFPKYTQMVVKNSMEEIQEFIQTFNNAKKKFSGM